MTANRGAGADTRRSIVLPEARALRELRHALARGGLPAPERRSPEDWARIASFGLVSLLMRTLDEFKRRVERGERCRIVARELDRTADRVVAEIAVEPDT